MQRLASIAVSQGGTIYVPMTSNGRNILIPYATVDPGINAIINIISDRTMKFNK